MDCIWLKLLFLRCCGHNQGLALFRFFAQAFDAGLAVIHADDDRLHAPFGYLLQDDPARNDLLDRRVFDDRIPRFNDLHLAANGSDHRLGILGGDLDELDLVQRGGKDGGCEH